MQGWRRDRLGDGPDAFVGAAPDAVIVSIRQTSQKFTDNEPGIEQDPERSKRAGNVHTLAEAIVRLANLGVKVINISVVSCQSVANMVSDSEVGQAVRYAAETKDVLIVSAAGNQGQNGCTQNPAPQPADKADPLGWGSVQTVVAPGWYDKYVMTVAATDSFGAPLTGQDASLHGPWVSLAAPGVDIEGLSTQGEVINASVNMQDMTIKRIGGSSFASAIVAGVAAQVRAKFPEMSAAQVRHRLEYSAHPPAGGRDTVVGFGVVNPVGALTWDIPDPPAKRVSSAQLQMPPEVVPEDPRPGHAMLWGGITAAALTAAVGLTIKVRRRRKQQERA
ncbi:type VII secretion-associated serine protease mycosin [Mycobacteroides abscessus subsp. abscessus]|nr:type VII secretion-associated serine protease mycosin [Mycobacteroides abscessus subsp. abscessus]